MIIGTVDGKVRLYLNIGTDSAPVFDEGVFLQVGPPGEKADIYHTCSACPCIVDWNEDGRRDLLVGAADGQFHLYLNEGSDHQPDYQEELLLQGASGELRVPIGRSSPDMADFDGDGIKDMISGDVSGCVWFFPNRGAHDAPQFDFGYRVEAGSVILDIPSSSRARPFVCDWTGDQCWDLLVGSYWSTVHLYQGIELAVPAPASQPALATLHAPWPNPANPKVSLSFTLLERTDLRLSVFDAQGRQVAVLAEGTHEPGDHRVEWLGRDAGGRPLPTGIYCLRLAAGSTLQTRKVVLLK